MAQNLVLALWGSATTLVLWVAAVQVLRRQLAALRKRQLESARRSDEEYPEQLPM